MPCKTCGTKIIYLDEDSPECPRCKRLAVVPYDDSLKIMNYFIKKLHDMFLNDIKRYHKDHILVNVFWQREKQIRKLHEEYSTINITRLLSCNLLLRRLIKLDIFLNQEIIDAQKIEKIIETYAQLADFEEDKTKLEAGNWTMLTMVKYDLNNLDRLPLMNSVIICPNEDYNRVMKIFEKHNVLPQKKADDKMRIWKTQFVPPILGSERSLTSKDTISRFYELISDFYVALFRSKVYSEAFELSKLEKITIDPLELKTIATLYLLRNETQSATKYSDFQATLITKLGGKFRQFLENFVISEENPNANPLFLRVKNFHNNNDDDLVLISQAFTEFFSYPLHAILNRDLFDKEVEKRSKKFESEIVKKDFERKNFHYISNHVVKNRMEIDGIAISDSLVYVIEVKGWKSKKLIEEKTTKEISRKEIICAIDGIHYDYDSGTQKKKVSLPQKVTYVSQNRSRFKISSSAKIQGLLIINEEPVLSNYNNCEVKFVNDFEFN